MIDQESRSNGEDTGIHRFPTAVDVPSDTTEITLIGALFWPGRTLSHGLLLA